MSDELKALREEVAHMRRELSEFRRLMDARTAVLRPGYDVGTHPVYPGIFGCSTPPA